MESNTELELAALAARRLAEDPVEKVLTEGRKCAFCPKAAVEFVTTASGATYPFCDEHRNELDIRAKAEISARKKTARVSGVRR